jgi:hypothetical protein
MDTSTIPQHEIIPCHMILKMKYKADGSKDRMKARLVAGGNFEYQEDILDNSSPTVDILTFMTLISLLSYLKWEMQSIDIIGAYPKANISNQRQFMRIGKNVANLLINIYPQYAEYLKTDGSITVRLKKALYGLKESGKLWNELLSMSLLTLDFKQSSQDPCLFYKENIYICIYVDDIFCIAKDKVILQEFNDQLKLLFNDIRVYNTNEISYRYTRSCNIDYFN